MSSNGHKLCGIIAALTGVLLLLAAQACGGGGGETTPDPEENPTPAAAQPPAGEAYVPTTPPLSNLQQEQRQVAATTDGGLIEEFDTLSLTVPAGGLPGATPVEITSLWDTAASYRAVVIDSGDVELSAPATIEFDVTGCGFQSLDDCEIEIVHYFESADPTTLDHDPGVYGWSAESAAELGVAATLSFDGNRVTLITDHFSGYSISSPVTDITLEIGSKYLQPGDIVLRMSHHDKGLFKKEGFDWIYGHIGLVDAPVTDNEAIHSYCNTLLDFTQPGVVNTILMSPLKGYGSDRSFTRKDDFYKGARRPGNWTAEIGIAAQKTAIGFLGAKYRPIDSDIDGIAGIGSGFSCSGLVEYAYEQHGIDVSPGVRRSVVTPKNQYLSTWPVDLVEVALGDMLIVQGNFIYYDYDETETRKYKKDNSQLYVGSHTAGLVPLSSTTDSSGGKGFYLAPSGGLTVYTSGLGYGQTYRISLNAQDPSADGNPTYKQNLWVRIKDIAPQLTAVTPLEGREGVSYPFSATNVGGTTPEWTWNFGGGALPSTSQLATPQVKLGAAGTYNCTVTARNETGEHTLSFQLTVKPQPPKINSITPANPAGLEGEGLSFGASLSGGAVATWEWNFGGGATPNTSSSPTPAVTLATPGTYSCKLKVSNATGSAEQGFSLTVNKKAVKPEIQSVTPSPAQGNVGSQLAFSAVVTGDPVETWAWSFGGGGTPDSSSQANPTITLGSAGTYSCTLTATNAGGSDTESFSLTVTDEVNPPVLTSVSPTQGANGSEAVFSAVNTGEPAINWHWDFGGGANPNTSSSESPAVTLSNTPGIFNGYVEATNGAGSSRLDFQFEVIELPPDITRVSPTSGSQGSTVTFSASNQGGAATAWEWIFNDAANPATSNLKNPQVTLLDAGEYGCSVSAVNAEGNSTKEFTLTVLDSGGWIITKVMDSGGSNFSRIANINGTPAMAFQSEDGLAFVIADNPVGTSWSSPVVITDNSYSISRPSICETNGMPVVATTSRPFLADPDDIVTSQELLFFVSADASGSSWNGPIRPEPDLFWIVVVKDLQLIDNHPAILYDSFHLGTGSPSGYKYVRASNSLGTSWSLPSLLPIGHEQELVGRLLDCGSKPSLPLRASTETGADISFIQATNANGNEWSSPTLVKSLQFDNQSEVSGYSVNGIPALLISTSSLSGEVYTALDTWYVLADSASGNSWSDFVHFNLGWHDGASLDNNGLPQFLGFTEAVSAKYNSTDPQGSNWTDQPVAWPFPMLFNSHFSSIDGHIVLAYQKKVSETEYELYFAYLE